MQKQPPKNEIMFHTFVTDKTINTELESWTNQIKDKKPNGS